MNLEQEVAQYGAKGAVLDYIRKNAPQVPIQPFILVPVGQDWREHEKEIGKLGDSLVRSSSPLEDGQEMSFAGLFGTDKFEGQRSVDYVLASLKHQDTLRYAQIHGVTKPIEMGLVFQRDSKSKWNWGILRHPHLDNILFIMGRPVPDRYRFSENFVYDEKTGKLQDVHKYHLSKVYGEKQLFEDMPNGIEEAIETYGLVEKLPAFQNGFTYHMEFGTDPFSVHQFRPFRKKQKSDWKIDFSKLEKMEGKFDMAKFGISFGITDKQGLDLKITRALCPESHKEHIKRFRKDFVGRPYEETVKGLLKEWDLSLPERVYAEELAQMDPDVFGAVESRTFDLAVEKLNASVDKSKTCLYQENMHFYFGRDIDLSFPNARTWIARGGIQFLSHNWFRAAQSYEFSLLGHSGLQGKTGHDVKIISDGDFAIAIEPRTD